MQRIWLQGLAFSVLMHGAVLAGAWLWGLVAVSEPPRTPPIQARLVAPKPEPAPEPEPAPKPETEKPKPAKPEPKEPEAKPEPKPETKPEPEPEPEAVAQAQPEPEEPEKEPEKPAKPEKKEPPEPKSSETEKPEPKEPEPKEPEPKEKVARSEPEEKPEEEAGKEASDQEPKEPEESPEPILGEDISRRIERLAQQEGDRPRSLRHRKARDQFVSSVRTRVQDNWLLPPGLDDHSGLRATVRIALTPGGELAAPPKIVASNGPGYFNSSVIRAVEKAAPFPMPEGPTRYFQHFQLKFSPDMVR